MLRKIIAICFFLIIAMALAACNREDESGHQDNEPNQEAESAPDTQEAQENDISADTQNENDPPEDTTHQDDPPEPIQTEINEGEDNAIFHAATPEETPPQDDPPEPDPAETDGIPHFEDWTGAADGTISTTLALSIYNNFIQAVTFAPGEPGAFDIDFLIDIFVYLGGEDFDETLEGNIILITDGSQVETLFTMDFGGILGDMLGGFFSGMDLTISVYNRMENSVAAETIFFIDGVPLPMMFLGDLADFEIDLTGFIELLPELAYDDIISAQSNLVTASGNHSVTILLDSQAQLQGVLETAEDLLPDLRGIVLGDTDITLVTGDFYSPVRMTIRSFAFTDDTRTTPSATITAEFIFNAFGDEVEINI